MRDARLEPIGLHSDVMWTSKSWDRQTYHWGMVMGRQGRHVLVALAKDSPGYTEYPGEPDRARKANLRLVRPEVIVLDRRADFINSTRLFQELGDQASRVAAVIKDQVKALDAAEDLEALKAVADALRNL